MKTMKLVLPVLAVLAYGPVQAAPPPPSLGSELASFAVLGGSTVTNAGGGTTVNGNLGVSPGTSITGFPPGIVNGTIHQTDGFATTAQTQLGNAIADLTGMGPGTAIAADLVGQVLSPGVYRPITGGFGLSGTLTLQGTGSASDYWVFEMPATTLITASNSNVTLINAGANAVYWNVGSSATLGSYSSFAGNILASASITMDPYSTLYGRALAGAAVTMSGFNIVTAPVPEPETYAMMLAGLGLLGFMARRRKAS